MLRALGVAMVLACALAGPATPQQTTPSANPNAPCGPTNPQYYGGVPVCPVELPPVQQELVRRYEALVADSKVNPDPVKREADLTEANVLGGVIEAAISAAEAPRAPLSPPSPAPPQPSPQAGVAPPPASSGVRVISPSQCTGPIVAGVCHGGVVPRAGLPLVCHGQMLNGQCTGPMF